MVGVLEAEDVSHVLDDHVLEAASGADERHAALAGQADDLESRLHVPVRTRGRDPEGVVVRDGGLGIDGVGAEPVECEPDVSEGGVR